MTLDTRTDAERRYDAERDGTLYFTPTQDERQRPHTPLFIELMDWIDEQFDADPQAAAMDADEAQIVDWILNAVEQQDANSDPVCTFTETRGAVTVERWEGPDSVFLDFTVGGDGIPHRVLLGVVLEGNNPDPGTAEFVLDGAEVDNDWTLPRLRQLRDDLDALLADERVLSALAEQPPA